MRAIVQRVSRASVHVGEELVGQIGSGLLVYVGVGSMDDVSDAEFMANKIRYLRIFEDDAGKMNRDVVQAGGGVLAVSNFTLYADAGKGRRPAFTHAAPPETASKLYQRVCESIGALGVTVQTGRFQAAMAVASVNDGPINVILDSRGPSAS